MSSSPRGSLLDLAERCQLVDDFLKDKEGPWDRGIFLGMQDCINQLQTWCPNHPGITGARVMWYERGLDEFRAKALIALRENPKLERLPDTMMDLDCMAFFLRHSYLKEEFPRLYRKVIQTLKHGRQIATKADNRDFIQLFHYHLDSLKNKLIQGRL